MHIPRMLSAPPGGVLRTPGGWRAAALCLALLAAPAAGTAQAQCPEAAPLQNYTGTTRAACPCFVQGEQAGVVLTAPAGDYPLEILRVGIAWGSQLGGAPQSLEEAIHIYAGGLPDPGTPIFSLPGPVLNDGYLNEFDLEPLPGEIDVASGPFTVSLEFLNDNAGDIYAPSVVHDANGCQANKNVIYAVPGGWNDACALGVSGDWVMYAIYRPCIGSVGVEGETKIAMSRPLLLLPPRPNPAPGGATQLDFALARAGDATLSIYDVSGRRIAEPASGSFGAGLHHVRWDGKTLEGTPAAAGVYFLELRAGADRARRTLLVAR